MQRELVTYTTSDRVYGSPNITGGNAVTYMPLNTMNIQPGIYVGSSDNYGYGFSQQKEIRNPQVFVTSPSIPQFTTSGVPIKSSTVQYVNQNPIGSGVRGPSIAVNPSNVTYARPLATVQTGSVGSPANFVQPQDSPFVQSAKTSFVQPPVPITYAQQQTSNYVQPPLITYNTQQNEPLQKTSSKVQNETLGNTWAEQQFERPKYPKLFNNSAEYYRNLAPQEDPTGKKTCCSSCCWILVGLIGLLTIVFGVLCGLGIVFGDSFNFSLPSDSGKNKPATVTPSGTEQQVVPVEPVKPVVVPVTPVTPIYPANVQTSNNPNNSINPTTIITQPVTTPVYLSPSTVPPTVSSTQSNTYGYDLGYQPTSVTSNDFNSVPLSTDSGQQNPTTVDPITATYQ